MEKHPLALKTSEIFFAKIVANPTPLSWSQIYNAGSLFAILSLKYKEISDGEVPLLSMVGKEVFNKLEEEYFTLEIKDFNTVKDAVIKSLETIPESVTASYIVAAIPPGKENILYLYNIGGGTILVKRMEKIGMLLEKSEDLQSASGILEDKDIIVLQTEEFSKTISHDALVSSLDLPPSDIADLFSAKIHQDAEGREAALILSYHKKQAQHDVVTPSLPIEEDFDDTTQEAANNPFLDDQLPQPSSSINSFKKTLLPIVSAILNKISLPRSSLTHGRKMLLTIAVILIGAIIISGFFAVKKQQEVKTQEELQKIMTAAEKKYNEGQVLAALNKNLANDDFEEAKTILEKGKNTFKSGSKEEKQINELLAKVTASLNATSGTVQLPAKEVAKTTRPFLETLNDSKALHATYDENTLYFLTNTEIFSTNLTGDNKKTLVKNDGSWKNSGGLGVFGTNLYVLDKSTGQIYKFVPTGDTYAKSDYLSKEQSFDSVSSMAIDSSIWVLSKNGSIQKFTRGNKDSFSITNLERALSNTTRIFTNAETTNVYILDNGNKRIVVLAKNGSYVSEYQSNVLEQASDFEVLEKQKKIFVLSQGKIYELSLP